MIELRHSKLKLVGAGSKDLLRKGANGVWAHGFKYSLIRIKPMPQYLF